MVKHALLCRILSHLGEKPTPFRFVDTHAGIGLYDLSGPEPTRTGEWQAGIGRLDAPLDEGAEAVLAPFRAALAAVRLRHGPLAYPGSPALARHLLRAEDRALLIEKHPDDAATLARQTGRAPNLKVLAGDGWAALPGLIPPKERRGLVLIDPPYEEAGELDRLPDRIAKMVRRWPTGILALWYPVKAAGPVDTMARALAAGLDRPALRLELLVSDTRVETRLNGSGLIVVNPPWRLDEDAQALLPALAERLGRDPSAGHRCELLATTAV